MPLRLPGIPNAGPVPENPVLVQIGFDLNFNNTKILATYTTTTPVPAQGPLWSVDVTDMVKKLVDDINNILSPNYDPNTSSFPLDLSATVKVILVQKCTPQYGPVTTIKGLVADVINSPIKVTPALTIGDPQ